mgnify:FL=1
MKKLLLASVVLVALFIASPALAITSNYHPADTNRDFVISFPEANVYIESLNRVVGDNELLLFNRILVANITTGIPHYYYRNSTTGQWEVTTTRPTAYGVIVPTTPITQYHSADTNGDFVLTFPEASAFLDNPAYTQAQKTELVRLFMALFTTGHRYYFQNTTTNQWDTSATRPNFASSLQIFDDAGLPVSSVTVRENWASRFYVRKNGQLYDDWSARNLAPVSMITSGTWFNISGNPGSAGSSGQIEFFESVTGPKTYLTVTVQAASTPTPTPCVGCVPTPTQPPPTPTPTFP